MPPLNTEEHKFLKKVYNASSVEESRAVYDEWASKYDDDLVAQDYTAPTVIAQALLKYNGNVGGAILDAGCGTGLTGAALLSLAGAKTIDGIDLSPGMLKMAERTGAYRDLAVADLSKPIDKPEESYDTVTCVGTLTKGHVGPTPVLREFVRITKPGGLIAATVLDDVWETGGYENEVEKLKAEGSIQILQVELVRIGGRDGVDTHCRIVVLKKR